MKLKLSLIILMLTFITFYGYSQLNFTVAFNAGYTLAKNNNLMLSTFNTDNESTLSEAFKPLRVQSGLELGLRYNSDFSAIILGFATTRRGRTANQVLNNEEYGTTVNYTSGTPYIGIETGTDKVRLGTSIGYRNLKIKASIANTSDLETHVQERGWVSKFYIDIKARGNQVSSIALRPYFDFAWGSTDIGPAYERLLMRSATINSNFHMIGLSVVFFNGPQNTF